MMLVRERDPRCRNYYAERERVMISMGTTPRGIKQQGRLLEIFNPGWVNECLL